MQFLEYMDFSHVFAHLPLVSTLRQDRWKLLDFGPKMKIHTVSLYKGRNAEIPLDTFAEFISDEAIQSSKFYLQLVLDGAHDLECQNLLFTIINVFLKATFPEFLFNEVCFGWGIDAPIKPDQIIKAVHDRFKTALTWMTASEVMEWMPIGFRERVATYGPNVERHGFRLKHPKLEWTLEAAFARVISEGGVFLVKHIKIKE